MRADEQIADFDSATGMLRVLGEYLRGRDAPLLARYPGAAEPFVAALLGAANRLPRRLQEKAYAASGWAEALPADRMGEVRADELAEWVVGRYPRRRYPAVFVGSSNGAMTHLAAALGACWLPQTLLIPVRRRGGHPDRPAEALRTHRDAGRALLRANPDLELHHMHDANQDRLMVAGMSYFRVKWRRLPEAYERFLRERLAPGGMVISVECGLSWPTTRIGERHVFQHGALGGATAEEFRHGSPRVAEFLARYGSPYDRWDAPEPDGVSPEAEWGFQDGLLDSLGDVAARAGATLRRLRFDAPEDLSPVVADLYRDWYRRRGIAPDRLLVENFLLVEPWWTLRTGSVPFWTVFNTEPSRQALLRHLDQADPYDEIRLILFSHGVESVGLASIDDWGRVLDRARKVGVFTGVDARAYPRDFAVFARAHRELARTRHRVPMPARPLDVADVDEFLEKRDDVGWSA
ncbi:hypothetical protein OG417_52540 [Actinoallomurus sp. NBC_01490]|uniref:hypothetical protein n=1 Tax=Actinoallomurus sp. NBC_01490 TaxID=2903557 RepID=UPI002E3355A1|nr:hypothetical protein [Actinoallomurus sp. NBC_01490]